MKDYVTAARPHRQRQGRARRDGHADAGGGLKIGAAMKMVDLAEHAQIAQAVSRGRARPRSKSARRRSATRAPSAATSISGRAAGTYRNEEFVCFKKGGNQCFSPSGENQFHAIFGDGPSFIVHPSSLAVPFVAYGATFRLLGPKGERMVPAADYFTMPTLQNVQHGERARAERAADARDPAGARHGQERPLRSALQGHRTTGRSRSRPSLLAMNGDTVQIGPRRHGRGRAGAVALAGRRSRRSPASRLPRRPRPRPPKRRCAARGRSARTPTRFRSRRPPSSAPSCRPRGMHDRLSRRTAQHGIPDSRRLPSGSTAFGCAPRACTSRRSWTRPRQRSTIHMRQPRTGA